MDALLFHFPVSGVETWIFLPPLVMFLIASATSLGGVTGAFILLPFNMSVLGYVAPGVTSTNFVYNIVAIPLGVSRYVRQRSMCWPLFAILLLGTLPGLFLGYWLRMTVLEEPGRFKVFVGLVLLYLAVRTFQGFLRDVRGKAGAQRKIGRLEGGRIGLASTVLRAEGDSYTFRTVPLFLLALVVGVVGGAYGIGGGAVLAPFCIAVLGLPPFVVAGASLLSTWATSVLGAVFYAYGGQAPASPDWLLGGLYGVGGMAGVYVGARLQGKVPASYVKLILTLALLFIAGKYLLPHALALLG